MRYIPLEQHDLFVEFLDVAYRRSPRLSFRRDALACIFGLHGLRVSEVLHLRYSDFSWAQKILKVETLKGGDRRFVQLDGTVIDWFWEVDADLKASKHGFVFRSQTGQNLQTTQLNVFARMATGQFFGEEMRFHGFRHTFGMRAYHQTRDLMLVARMMGHRSIKSTQIYVEAVQQFDAKLAIKVGPSTHQHDVTNPDHIELPPVNRDRAASYSLFMDSLRNGGSAQPGDVRGPGLRDPLDAGDSIPVKKRGEIL